MATPASVLTTSLKMLLAESVSDSGTLTWVDTLGLVGSFLQATSGSKPTIAQCSAGTVALTFDGSNDFVKSAGFAAQPSERYRCVFLVFKSTAAAGSRQELWWEKDTVSGEDLGIWIETDGKIHCTNNGVSDAVSNSSVANDGSWHSLILYVDTFNTPIKMYVDGTLQTTQGNRSGGSAMINGSRGDIWLGIGNTDSNNPFTGSIATLGYAYSNSDFVASMGSLGSALFDTYIRNAASGASAVIGWNANDSLVQIVDSVTRDAAIFDSDTGSWFDVDELFQLDQATSSTASANGGVASLGWSALNATVSLATSTSSTSVAWSGVAPSIRAAVSTTPTASSWSAVNANGLALASGSVASIAIAAVAATPKVFVSGSSSSIALSAVGGNGLALASASTASESWTAVAAQGIALSSGSVASLPWVAIGGAAIVSASPSPAAEAWSAVGATGIALASTSPASFAWSANSIPQSGAATGTPAGLAWLALAATITLSVSTTPASETWTANNATVLVKAAAAPVATAFSASDAAARVSSSAATSSLGWIALAAIAETRSSATPASSEWASLDASFLQSADGELAALEWTAFNATEGGRAAIGEPAAMALQALDGAGVFLLPIPEGDLTVIGLAPLAYVVTIANDASSITTNPTGLATVVANDATVKVD